MDLFGKKKIEQLERDAKHWEDAYKSVSHENNQNKKEIERLKAIIRGDRVCDGYCKHCKNSIATKKDTFIYGNFCTSESYTCVLDCKCKDFQKAE